MISPKIFLSGCLALLIGAAVPGADAPAKAAHASATAFAPAESYQVTVLGDIHFDAPEFHRNPAISEARQRERKRNFAMWQAPSLRLLEAAGRQTARSSAFTVQLGDLAQGDCETAEQQEAMLRQGFAAVKKNFPDQPVLVVKGNHDVRVHRTQNNPAPVKNALLPLVAGELGVGALEDGCYAVRKGKDLFLAVDGFTSKERIVAFVRKSLADNPDCRYVILLTHLPIFPASASWPFWLLPGGDEVAALLETRRAVVLAAHTHIFSLIRCQSPRGSITQFVTTSMGNAWSPGARLVPQYQYAEYLAKVEQKGEKYRDRVAAMRARGEYSGQIFRNKAGFTVLDINDRRIEARVYTDDSGKPAFTAVLAEASRP